MTTTSDSITSQLTEHGIEFGTRYRDPASGFEGEASALHFYKHGCLRVQISGRNNTTGEPADFVFDAPQLVAIETEKPVPPSTRTGGPHDRKPVPR